MSYFKKVEAALEGKENFHLHESKAGDTEIRYKDPDGIAMFITAVLPAGVKASSIDTDYDRTRYRVLYQGEKGDKLLSKVKELVPDPENVEDLIDAIEKVAKEYIEDVEKNK